VRSLGRSAACMRPAYHLVDFDTAYSCQCNTVRMRLEDRGHRGVAVIHLRAACVFAQDRQQISVSRANAKIDLRLPNPMSNRIAPRSLWRSAALSAPSSVSTSRQFIMASCRPPVVVATGDQRAPNITDRGRLLFNLCCAVEVIRRAFYGLELLTVGFDMHKLIDHGVSF